MIKMKRAFLCFATALAFGCYQPLGKADDGPKTEIEQSMDKMSKAFRALRKQVADAGKNAESLQLVATIKSCAEEAKKHTPELAADKPEADRTQFTADYKKRMDEFIGLIDQLSDAIKANDNAAAQNLTSKLGAMQKTGHKDFKKPDKDEKK